MNFSGTTCLVTGGAGFIGSNLVRALLAEGARVIVVDNFTSGQPEHLPAAPGLNVIEHDLATVPDLEALVARADYVFHLAAQVGNIKSIEQTESDAQTNILASVRLFKACRGSRVRRIVYSSSSAIFGEAQRIPIDEAHPQQPASFYALSKQTGEKYALLGAALWGLPTVCLRYFNVYGYPMEQNEYAGVIPIFMHRLESGQGLTIYGDGSQFRDFVYVADVVQANLRAALHGAVGGVYNIGTGQPTTILALAHMLCELADLRPEIDFRAYRPAEVRESLADITRARAELGYAPAYDLRRGLSETWRLARAGRATERASA